MFVIVGWLVAIGCIFGVFIAHGGNIHVVLHALPFELITIFGGALGAFVANNQMKVLKATGKGLGLKGGRVLNAADRTPMANLQLSLLGRFGFNVDAFRKLESEGLKK